MLLRYVLSAILLYGAFQLLVRMARFIGRSRNAGHETSQARRDAAREVKPAAYDVEQVQDAKFRDA